MAGLEHPPAELSLGDKRDAIESKEDGAWRKFADSDVNDHIKRLKTLTGGDMKRWAEFIQPEYIRVICVQGLTTTLKYQRQAAGSALTQWAILLAGEHGVYC